MAPEEKDASTFWAEEPKLYTMSQKTDDGTYLLEGYAYGLPWVRDALMEGDICFQSPEEAKAWWERRYGS